MASKLSKAERRLAAIMFTDIVGYTAMSQEDEEATMKILEAHRNTLRPHFSRHGGKEVKTMGDAFLVEFGSSLEAVRCALAIQRAISENDGRGRGQRLRLRIGVHVGEVIHSENDVYGDAVNIAARIEPLAEPGGICISRQVYDFVQNKVDARITRMGPVELKNVKEPVEVYKVQNMEEPGRTTPRDELRRRVAVLPFDNFSPDPGDEYFADGLTEEMIGTLSKIRELSVISRTSVMQYKARPKPIPEIGRELNAGTILEGSVRKMENRARVSVQMIDAMEDRHVWADSYDRDLQDIFAVQSDIATRVAEELKVELLAAEKEGIREAPTKSAEANLLYLKGLYQGNKGSPSDLLKAVEYFELAVEEDPQFALAYASISSHLVGAAGEVLPSSEAFPRAERSLTRAMEIGPGLAEVQNAKGWLAFQYEWDWMEAERCFETAITISPSLALAHDFYGRTLACLGRLEDAIVEMSRANELDPASSYAMIHLGVVYWMAGRNADARDMFGKALEGNPKSARALMLRAFVSATEERRKDARRDAEAAVAVDDQAHFRALQAVVYASTGLPDEVRKILERLLQGKYKGYSSPYMIGSIYYWLEDKEKGYEWMRRAYEERDPSIPWYNGWPILEINRKDPRFVEMLHQMKLP